MGTFPYPKTETSIKNWNSFLRIRKFNTFWGRLELKNRFPLYNLAFFGPRYRPIHKIYPFYRPPYPPQIDPPGGVKNWGIPQNRPPGGSNLGYRGGVTRKTGVFYSNLPVKSSKTRNGVKKRTFFRNQVKQAVTRMTEL